MNILTFTTLYPNAAQPYHGVFVENRLRHLVASGEIDARVVAPVPWFPLTGPRFGRYAALAGVPAREERFELAVDHPRYVVIPKVGMSAAPFLLYAAARAAVERVIETGYDFALIDAHYFYPDGVAAAMLGRRFGKPVSITARGTDLNLIPKHALARRMIQWAAGRAAGLVTVCQALKDALVELDVPVERVRVLRNGVDLDLFRPVDRAAARAGLGVDGPTLLAAGHLIARKSHDLVIAALPALPGMCLVIVGDGPEERSLKALARRLGVEDRVRFLGRIAHEEMRDVYTAADALVLASSREGWANVLLEAMACGTPVVASNVWGTPEVVASPAAGVLMPERTADGVAQGVRALFAALPDRAATRAYAEGFSWDATTRGQLDLFADIVGRGEPGPDVTPGSGPR
ncbi:MAG: glycosyltransferase family 4 protein [Alphaproteobacteria bacterium]